MEKQLPIIVLVPVFAVVNVIAAAIVPHAREPVLPGIMLGVLAGESGLIAIWAVIGPQPWMSRFLITQGLAIGLYLAFLFGLTIAGHGPPAKVIVVAVLVFPLVLLCVQLPVWIAKIAMGWRLVGAGSEDPAPSMSPRQFGIEHLLGATTVVAVAMGLASLGLQILSETGGTTGAWTDLLWTCLGLSLWGAFAMLPCIWAALVARNRAVGAVIIGVYTVLPMVTLFVLSPFSGPPMSLGRFLFLQIFHAATMLVLMGGLHYAKFWGFELLRPDDGEYRITQQQQQEPAAAPAASSDLEEQ